MDRTARMTSAVRFFAALLFCLVGSWPARAMAFVPPPPQGAVTDTSGKLSAADDASLEAEIAGYRARTGHELAVLMVGSLGDESVDDVAYAAFNKWGVGRKGADDGVLLVIAPNERKMRIETGKGVGDRLTDLESSHILREKVGPLLKENRFREAISAGLTAIEAALDSGDTTSPPGVKSAKSTAPASHGVVAWLLPVLVLGFCLLVVIGIVYLMIRASGRTRSNVGSYGSPPDSYRSSDWSSGGGSSSTSDWGGGGGGGSSGGSDFGGGSSGGGGSSDSY